MKKISRVQGKIGIRSVILPNGVAVGAEKKLYFGSISSLAAETRVYGDEIVTRSVDELCPDKEFEMGIYSIAKIFRILCIPLTIFSVILWGMAVSYNSPIELLCRVLIAVFISGIVAPRSMTRFFLKTFKKGEYLKESQFRGAVYQVINAFYELGRVPKMEELNNYSIFSRYDPYFERELKRPIAIIGAVCVLNFNWIADLIALVVMIVIIHFLFKTNTIYAMEILVVSKPDTKQQEAAIKTLEEAISFVDGIEVEESFVHIPSAEFIREFLDEEKCNNCPDAEQCFLYQMVKKETQN